MGATKAQKYHGSRKKAKKQVSTTDTQKSMGAARSLHNTQALQNPEQEACTTAAQPMALDPRRLSNRCVPEVTK